MSEAKRARVAGHAVPRHAPLPPPGADPAQIQAFHHEQYFAGYAGLAVHQEMLRDEARTLAYKSALEACADDIRGKVVLDVGCGTGVLSIFAARVGARRVYAVEASALAEQARVCKRRHALATHLQATQLQTRQVVADNGLSEVITVIQGKIEDISLPEQADVLVSEWMGYALLYENMLGSVLHARDAWLRPGGLLLPSHATLWCAPLSDEARFEDAAGFWSDDVYGIDMHALAPHALRCALVEPIIESFPPQGLLTWPVPLRRIDVATVAAAEVLPWEGSFDAASMGRLPCHGLAIWFDVEFHSAATAAAAAAQPPLVLGVGAPVRVPPPGAAPCVRLCTGPESPATHWMTTCLYLDAPLETQQDARIRGTLRMGPHASNERFLSLRLTLQCGEDGVAAEKSFDMT